MNSDTMMIDQLMLSATPSEEELRAWQALPRDEQLRRLRASLSHPDCVTVTDSTMTEILTEARARADARQRG